MSTEKKATKEKPVAPKPAELVQYPTAKLKPHRMFEKIRQPMMDDAGQEWASFVADVAAHGVREPILITEAGQVMDGRHRAKAAAEAGLETVPCIIKPDDEAALIIAGSLAHRRHYTKSGLAYVLHPFAQEHREAGERAKNANLRQNSPTTDSVGRRAEGSGSPMENFAKETGIGLDLLRMAKDVHEALESSGKKQAPDPETGMKRPVRELAEAMLFDRGIGLGGVKKWLGALGEDAAGNFQRGMANRNDYALQLTRHFEVLPKHFAHWDKVPASKRQELLGSLDTWCAQWPDDFAEAAMKALVATLRNRKAG